MLEETRVCFSREVKEMDSQEGLDPEMASWVMRQVRYASFSADFGRLNLKNGQEKKEVASFRRLYRLLQEAVIHEDYVHAASIRDEMNVLREKI